MLLLNEAVVDGDVSYSSQGWQLLLLMTQ